MDIYEKEVARIANQVIRIWDCLSRNGMVKIPNKPLAIANSIERVKENVDGSIVSPNS